MATLAEDGEFSADELERAKGTIDGARTLAEAAEFARAFADRLRSLHEAGYVLREPVEYDYAWYYMPDREEGEEGGAL